MNEKATPRPRKRRQQIDQIWVLGLDDGIEGIGGKKEPHMAFLTQAEAEQAKTLAEGPNGQQAVYIAQVPVWKRS